jgi:hypothetical protein
LTKQIFKVLHGFPTWLFLSEYKIEPREGSDKDKKVKFRDLKEVERRERDTHTVRDTERDRETERQRETERETLLKLQIFVPNCVLFIPSS